MTLNIPLIDRYRGSLLGLAVGDALGAPIEFMSPGTFEPVTDMTAGGAFGLEPGYWTDDTSMALCLAESLIECKGFNAADQMDRYLKWFRNGYMSSTGNCFDIGNTTRAALLLFERTRNPYSGSDRGDTAGNGSLMRLAPVPLFFANDPFQAIHYSAESSRTTHANIEALDACRYFSGLIIGALKGATKDEILSECYHPSRKPWQVDDLCGSILHVARGSFKIKEPPEIEGSGYVVKTLEASLWAFHRTDSFEEGLLKVINLGDDADTTGAVYGQLAGACYGISRIPEKWLSRLYEKEMIHGFADKLFMNKINIPGKSFIQ